MDKRQEKNNFGEFLQSEEWRKFQESVGRKTYCVPSPPTPLPPSSEGGGVDFCASIIEHQLPLAGKYFYIPKGSTMPISNFQPASPAGGFLISNKISNFNDQISKQIYEIISLAKKEKAGWIRVDLNDEKSLEEVKKNTNLKIAKAPHDMQPKEIFVIDISKTEEELLAEMKSKTRYNIKLAQKRGVSVQVISNFQPASPASLAESRRAGEFPISNKIQNQNSEFQKYFAEFLRLTSVMAKRQGITPHPDGYYRKMSENISGDILKLYIAEYEGKVIAANLVVFYGKTCIYLHGASDDEYRNVMAPYALQWRQIQDAREAGCERYDMGGVFTNYESNTNIRITNKNSWAGITRFKIGFSPGTAPTEFLGSYDIVIDPIRYGLYRIIQKIKSFL